MAAMLALAGDTMLGRRVAERLTREPGAALIAPEVADCIAGADAFVLNLECCISHRGDRFPDPGKRFFFRAPSVAARCLADLGVDAVTLANNHALDYGPDALLDTLAYLRAAGIAAVGAGADVETARAPVMLRCGGLRVRLVAFSDHPADYAAGPERPGIAFADLRGELPDWVRAAVRPGADADLVLATPHWGPNMVAGPQAHVRRSAAALLGAGASLIAGHSAHIFHGVAPRVIFDLGDFLDDYIVHPKLRNDLGLLWLVEIDPHGPRAICALPLALDYCFTRRASRAETDIIAGLLQQRCTPFGTKPHVRDGMIEVNTDAASEST
ncbi:MAG TPA: CapA family protein [Solirubrobacteraceae bacterium]|nr:CapA family protein [Solirubrobacteraceae bacterium]